MKQAAAPTTHASRSDRPAVLGTIGTDLLDTAWRIAVPVLLFTILGIIADRTFGTAPWVTLPAAMVGFVCAGWLVKRQLAALEAREREQ